MEIDEKSVKIDLEKVIYSSGRGRQRGPTRQFFSTRLAKKVIYSSAGGKQRGPTRTNTGQHRKLQIWGISDQVLGFFGKVLGASLF
jgi:hypothetical protein